MKFIRALTPRQLENVYKYKRKKPAIFVDCCFAFNCPGCFAFDRRHIYIWLEITWYKSRVFKSSWQLLRLWKKIVCLSKDVLCFALDISHLIEEEAGTVIQLSRIESVEFSGDGNSAVIAHEPNSIGLFHMRTEAVACENPRREN